MFLVLRLPTIRMGMTSPWRQSRWPAPTPKFVESSLALILYWLNTDWNCKYWHVSDVLNVWHLWNRNDALSPISLSSPFPQLPYEYYSLPLCEPPNGVRQYSSENLGQIIRWALDQFYWRKVFALARSKKDMNYEWNTAYSRGERIVNTPYKIGMNKNVECAVLCKDKK